MENPISRIDREAAQIRKEIASLTAAISSKEARLAVLVSARNVMTELGFEPEESHKAGRSASELRFTSMKTKDLILEALSTGPLWQTSNEIQETVSKWAGRTIPMSTISPYLSEMKKEGTIGRNGLNVAAALRLENEEPSFFKENGEAEASPETDQGTNPDQNPNPSPEGA